MNTVIRHVSVTKNNYLKFTDDTIYSHKEEHRKKYQFSNTPFIVTLVNIKKEIHVQNDINHGNP
jgi:hypothetical protein